MIEIPSKYNPTDSEAKWQEHWEKLEIYRWDSKRARGETFIVDTPPPTVSGSLHIGHVFSYTHQDLLVRFKRMCGFNIHYGMGWDDNGLPTERRVQNVFGIRCNPNLQYDSNWKPKRSEDDRHVQEVSRLNFIEACRVITEEDEKVFERLWRRLGLSVDWCETYATIDDHCRRLAQLSFIDLVDKGLVYSVESPTMWDVDFQTAVAQAEIEDRICQSAMHELRFGVTGGGEFTIATSRPELLASCIAVVAHPDDTRYKAYFGKTAITPLFFTPVPIVPSVHAEPEKGTGIMMVCTFGDAADVEWWKQSELPLKRMIGFDGKLIPVTFGESPFDSINAQAAQQAYNTVVGLNINAARKQIVKLMRESGSCPNGGPAMISEPQTITHPVKFYERGERPLEFVTTRQWYVNILEHKKELIEQGRKIVWHPDHMLKRYEGWVEGLNQDWCISRQRFFGVSFPVWYNVGPDGIPDHNRPIYAERESLPIDPLTDVPPGFSPDQRNKPGGFVGDRDVMDTWATSSLTPQIQSRWLLDPVRHARLFPMDIRPQAHEIIRTWAFYTIVKAWMHENQIPWKNIVISGWVLDPDRKKMSKSKGNVITPEDLLDEFSVDGARYWASRARLGTDTALDKSVFKTGNRLAIKIFNASRFVFMQQDQLLKGDPIFGPEHISHPIDIALIARLREVVCIATREFERFEYAAALQVSEEAFWNFCDHYLELVKSRYYSEEDTPDRRSAVATLNIALSTLLRLIAPFVPYVTEEVWSWRLAVQTGIQSIHTASWPSLDEFSLIPKPSAGEAFTAAVEVLTKIRSVKSQSQKSLKWPVSSLKISGPITALNNLETVLNDVLNAGCVESGALEISEGISPENGVFNVIVTLSEEPSK